MLKLSWDLGLELASGHLYHILLTKASLASRDGEVDSIAAGKELQSLIAIDWRQEQGELESFLQPICQNLHFTCEKTEMQWDEATCL